MEIGRILLEQAVIQWREKTNKKGYLIMNKEIDLSIIRIFMNEEFKKLIVKTLTNNSNIHINEKIFSNTNTLRDIQMEIGNSQEHLKIQKKSKYYKYVLNNDKILFEDTEPEDIFYYFLQNIKSDLYILKNSTDVKIDLNIKKEESSKNETKKIDNKYTSVGSEMFFSKSNEEINFKKKNSGIIINESEINKKIPFEKIKKD
jgi:hypothetical protein